MSDFKNKTVIITGAAIGLGLATAEVLAAKGANLSLVDYKEEALNTAKQELESKFPDSKILTFVADVSSEEDVKNFVEKTIAEFGKIDGFYNNAGIEGK